MSQASNGGLAVQRTWIIAAVITNATNIAYKPYLSGKHEPEVVEYAAAAAVDVPMIALLAPNLTVQ